MDEIWTGGQIVTESGNRRYASPTLTSLTLNLGGNNDDRHTAPPPAEKCAGHDVYAMKNGNGCAGVAKTEHIRSLTSHAPFAFCFSFRTGCPDHEQAGLVEKRLYYIGNILKKHNIVDRDIGNAVIDKDLSLI